ncbi:MAG: DNA-binding protein [Lachnospiraceae bacterium]
MNGYITARDAADKWNMSVRQIQNLCATGKLDGAIKFGNAWAIPEYAEKPQDGRITFGSYKNWRKKSDT